jgi:hypothetical protein
MSLTLLGAIGFDNEIRGILVVLVAVTVLIGSIYAILSTNLGVRLGFLVVGAALFGWLFLLGSVWWIYGIGFKGRDPAWMPVEVNLSRTSPVATQPVESLPPESELPDPKAVLAKHPLSWAVAKGQEKATWVPNSLTDVVTEAGPMVVLKPGDVTPEWRATVEKNGADVIAAYPEVADVLKGTDGEVARAVRQDAQAMRSSIEDQLNGWCLLSTSDTRRGDAIAASDAALAANDIYGSTTTTASYITKDVFIEGGKEPCYPITEQSAIQQAWHRIHTTFEVKNPKLYGVVTTVKALPQATLPGQAPPTPVPQPGASTVSTIMLRNLGNRRQLPATVAIISFLLFAVFVAQLHHRDKLVAQHLAEAEELEKVR